MDSFDFYQENLNRAQNADGSLQKQADLYAESWEASQKRVQAAIEEVYTDLIDDDFFIGLNDALANFIGLLDNLLKSMGGAKGLLTGVASILLNMFAGQAAQGLENMVYNFKSFVGLAQKEAMAQKEEAFSLIAAEKAQTTDPTIIARITGIQQQAELEQSLLGIKEKLSDEEAMQARAIIEQNQAYADQLQSVSAIVKERQTDTLTARLLVDQDIIDNGYGAANSGQSIFYSEQDVIEGLEQSTSDLAFGDNLAKEVQEASSAFLEGKTDIETYKQALNNLLKQAQDSGFDSLAAIITRARNGNGKAMMRSEAGFKTEAERVGMVGDSGFRNAVNRDASAKIQSRFVSDEGETVVTNESAYNYIKNLRNMKLSEEQYKKSQEALINSTKKAKAAIEALNNSQLSLAQTIVGVSQAAMSLSFGISSILSVFSTWDDDSIGFGEKLLQILMSAGMAIPMVINGIHSLTTTLTQSAVIQEALYAISYRRIGLQQLELTNMTAENLAKQTGINLSQAEVLINQKKAETLIAAFMTEQGLVGEKTKANIAALLGISIKETEILLSKVAEGQTLKQAMAEMGLKAAKDAGNASIMTRIAAYVAEKLAAMGLNATLATTIGLTTSLLIPVAALAAVIGGIVVACNQWSDTHNAENDAMERSNKTLQEQTANLETVKTKYEELKSAIDNYTSTYEILKSMIQGTEEWAAQVENVNKQVADLITKYPELSKYVTNNNGVLGFNSTDLEQVQTLENNKVKEAEYSKTAAQMQHNLDTLRANVADAAEGAYGVNDYFAEITNQATLWGTTAAGLGVGVGAASAAPTAGLAAPVTVPTAAAIMGVIGAIGGGVKGAIDAASKDLNSKNYYMTQIDNLIKEYSQFGEASLATKEVQKKLDALTVELGLHKDTLLDLIRSSKEVADTNRILAETQAQNLLSDNKEYQSSKYKEILDSKVADEIERVNSESLDNYKKKIGWSNDNFDYSEYLRLKYGDEAKNYRVTDDWGGDVTIEHYDDETKTWKNIDDKENDHSKKDIEKEYAQLLRTKAAEEAGKAVDILTIIEDLAKEEEKYRRAGITNAVDREAMVVATNLTEDNKINLGELTQATIDLITTAVENDSSEFGLTKKDIDTFESQGGQLGARNQDFSMRFQSAQQDASSFEKRVLSWNDTFFYGEGDYDVFENQILSSRKVYDENKQMVEDTLAIYNDLSEADKKIFAETIDFKQKLNKEAMLEILEAEKQARAEANLDSAASQYELDSDVLKKQAQQYQKQLEATNAEMENSIEIAAEMAVANQRMNKGVDTLTDDWEDWQKTLRSATKTSQDYAEACIGVEKVLRDILRLSDEDIIPSDFLENAENLNLIDQIANGSSDAVEQLQFNLLQAQISSIEMSNDISTNLQDIFNTENWSTDDFNAKWDEIKSGALIATQEIQNAFANLQPGESLSGESLSGWISALNTYIEASGMTVDEVNSMFEKMQVKPEVNTTTKTIESTKDKLVTHVKITNVDNENGTYDREEVQEVLPGDPVYETVTVPSINADATFTKKDAGNITPSVTKAGKTSGKSGGGSSSKPQKKSPVKAKKKDDEIERYHEISNIIKDQEKIVDRLNKSKDDLYGANRLKAMDKEIAANETLIKQNQTLLDEVQQNLALDRQKAAGYGFTFDEAGLINNYDEIMQQKMDEWLVKKQAAEDAIYAYEVRKNGNDGYDEDGSEKLALDEASQKVDDDWEEFKDSLSQYEETYEKVQEVQDYIDEKIRENMQKIFEKIEYTLTIRLELSEQDLSIIEQRLARLSDTDYTKTAERLALLSQQAKIFRIEAEDTKKVVDELTERYNLYLAGDVENGISQENYLAALKEKLQSVYEYENSLREGITSTGEELRNQFNLIDEKLESIYEKIQRRLDFAEFYKDISKIVNGETDYDTLNQVIDKQIKLTQVELDGLIAERDMWSQKRDNMQALLDSGTLSAEAEAQARESLAEIEGYIADANSNIQSDIQEMAELAQEEFTNAIEAIVKEWQDANFGESLDSVLEEIDLRNRAQEELLTKTNQVYETNKLIRQAEKDIAATSNKRAKQAYEEYINKAKQKQEQKELTQLELDLLTAEYEITKAQIALEEAKDAKDTVRLTRDSEGNFGYVYTANQDNINDAQQALEDATNNYYNIALEGAKSSSEQIYQLQQDWLQRVKEINQDATLSEEEKEAKIAEIDSYYETMIEQQRDKYYIAKAAVEESSYEHKLDYDLKEIESAEEWFNTHDELINDMADIREEYGDRVAVVADYVKKSYNNETDALEVLDAGTQQYSQDLDKLIPQMEDELTDAVDKATLSWFEYAKQLKEVIALNEQMTGSVEDATLKETYKNDYAQRIKELLAAGYSEDDPTIQKLLKYRLEKLGGVDDTDYKALIDAADNDLDKQLYTVLRNYKKSNNNWMQSIQNDILSGKSLEEYQWKYTFRDDKLEEMYGTADARTTAQDVEDWINEKDWFADITAGISEGVSIATTKILSDIRDNKQINLGLDPTTEADLQKWLVEDSGDFLQIGENILKDSNYNWDSCLETLTNIAHWQDEKLALLGQVGADTLSELYKWNEENKPKTETSNSNSINDDDWVLGTVSRPFEVGENGNGGSISNNSGDAGGVSYGLPQFATNTGSAKEFANWLASNYPEMGSSLKGLKPGTSAFNSAWKEIYNKYGIEFEQIQMDYAWDMFGAPWAERAQKKTGIDFTRSRALKELAYSTANQYGAAGTYVLPSGLNASMSDEEIVTAIQNYKLANVNSHFRSSNAATRAGVRNRIPQELESLLQLIYEDASYDTGGYTGDWGPEGRAAILHEKELVLNAEDTKNILTSVGIIREISKALDNSALWSALSMANLSASYIAAGGRDTLQQQVEIHADFPNVTDHNEIEMAIDNLINAASQYAYRG